MTNVFDIPAFSESSDHHYLKFTGLYYDGGKLVCVIEDDWNVYIMDNRTSSPVQRNIHTALVRSSQVYTKLTQQSKDNLNKILDSFSNKNTHNGISIRDYATFIYIIEAIGKELETKNLNTILTSPRFFDFLNFLNRYNES
jgi:hypothetical protein